MDEAIEMPSIQSQTAEIYMTALQPGDISIEPATDAQRCVACRQIKVLTLADGVIIDRRTKSHTPLCMDCINAL
jgi:hypothetical protein